MAFDALNATQAQWSQLSLLVKGTIFGGLFVLLSIVYWRRGRRKRLHKTDYKQDTVYLYQFPSCRTIVNVSPFALKVETWLRWQGIPYESTRSNTKWSKHGQIPFIELNGEQIADSNIIIQTLQKKFNKQDEGLTIEQQSIARAVSMMVENQTVWSYFYYRYVEDVVKFLHTWEFVNKYFRYFLVFVMKRGYQKRAREHGIAKHDVADIYDFGIQDIQAISNLLGVKKYFFGDQMSTLDCYLFGHLCQVIFIPIQYPHTTYIYENCQNLIDYVNRIKEELWPDWNKVCKDHMFKG